MKNEGITIKLRRGRIKIGIFLLFFFPAVIFTKTNITGWGDMARLATVESLVEKYTYSIDNSVYIKGGDKIYIQGHYYGAQPPVLPIIGSIVYSGIYYLLGLSFSSHPGWSYYLVTLLTMGVPTCLMLACFFGLIGRAGLSPLRRLLLTCTLAWGTLIFCYSLTYNSQSITAAALFISFYFIVRERHSGRGGKNALFWGGFLAALGFTIDPIPGGVFLALFLVYLFLRRAGWARILCYLLGSLVPILIYFFLKTSINDSNLDPFGTWFLKRGLIRHSTIGGYLRYALQSFLGIRGLFSYSPVLLFGLAGLIRLLRRPVHPYRLEAFIAAAFLLLSSFLTLLVTSTYGGWCYGIRYFVPLIPILFFFAAFAFESAGRPLKIIFILCLVVSLAVSAIGVAKPGTDCSRGKFTLINNIRFLRSRSGPELLRDYLPILRLIGRG